MVERVRDLMTVWISKYALSKGVYKIEVIDCSNTSPGLVRTESPFQEYFHDEGKEWHRRRADAVRKAEQMRDAKIASLLKQIAKLKKMNFCNQQTG